MKNVQLKINASRMLGFRLTTGASAKHQVTMGSKVGGKGDRGPGGEGMTLRSPRTIIGAKVGHKDDY